MTLIDVLAWPFRQVAGFGRNAFDYFRDFHLDDVLPPSIRDFLNWFFGIVPRAFGLRGASPGEQINAAAVLILVTFLTSIPTLGATLIVLVVLLPLLLIGILRWLPAFDELWRSIVSRITFVNRDIDIPGWRSE